MTWDLRGSHRDSSDIVTEFIRGKLSDKPIIYAIYTCDYHEDEST